LRWGANGFGKKTGTRPISRNEATQKRNKSRHYGRGEKRSNSLAVRRHQLGDQTVSNDKIRYKKGGEAKKRN